MGRIYSVFAYLTTMLTWSCLAIKRIPTYPINVYQSTLQQFQRNFARIKISRQKSHGKSSTRGRIQSRGKITAMVETTAPNTIPAARLFSFAHSALKASNWVCCSTSLGKKRGASLVAAQLFTNPLWRRSARSKEPEKGFAAM